MTCTLVRAHGHVHVLFCSVGLTYPQDSHLAFPRGQEPSSRWRRREGKEEKGPPCDGDDAPEKKDDLPNRVPAMSQQAPADAVRRRVADEAANGRARPPNHSAQRVLTRCPVLAHEDGLDRRDARLKDAQEEAADGDPGKGGRRRLASRHHTP